MILSNTPFNRFLPNNKVPYYLLILQRPSKGFHGSLGCISDLPAFFIEKHMCILNVKFYQPHNREANPFLT